MKLNFKLFILLITVFGIAFGATYKFDRNLSDFPAYYLTGKRMWAKTVGKSFEPGDFFSPQKIYNPGDTLYVADDVRPFKYTPVVAYLFVPLSFLSYEQARIVWFAFCYSLLIFSLFLLYKHFNFRDTPKTFFYFLILYLLSIRFILQDIKFLQINLVITFCLMGFLVWRKSRENLACFLLALLVSIKILPIFFLLFLLLEKDYRLILKTIGFGMILAVLPVISYGGNLIAEYQSYFHLMAMKSPDFPATASYWIPNVDSFVARLVMDRPYVREGFKINFLSLDPQSTFYIILAFKVLFLGVLIWMQRSLSKLKGASYEIYYFTMVALFANFINIINPVAWKHGLVTLIFSWAILLYFWFDNKKWDLKEKILIGILFFIHIFPWDFFSKDFKRIVLGGIGVDFLGVVVISLLLYFSSKRYFSDSRSFL